MQRSNSPHRILTLCLMTLFASIPCFATDLSVVFTGEAQGFATLRIVDDQLSYTIVVDGIGVPDQAAIVDGNGQVLLDLGANFEFFSSASGTTQASPGLIDNLETNAEVFQLQVVGPNTMVSQGLTNETESFFLLFEDGFESGDTTSWTVTIGQ